MPCYNTDKELLLRCVESILSQTFSDFELLIIDDGSKEDYRNIYDLILEKDSRIRVILKENGGVSSARNCGLQYATGRYIVFSDSDDVLLPYFLEEAYFVACREDADVVIGCNIHLSDYDEENRKISDLKDKDIVVFNNSDIIKLRPYMVGKRISFKNGLIYIGRGPWTRIVKREIAVAIPFDCNLSICEDIVWNLQILDKSNKVCYVSREWYAYNNSQEESATKGYNEKIIDQSREGLNKIKEYLHFDANEEYKAFCERCLEDVSNISHRYLSNKKCILTMKQKHQLRKKIYTEMPWNIVADKKFLILASYKDKLKSILYKYRLLFIIYAIDSFLR